MMNKVENWRDALPVPDGDSHKYTRGHAVVFGAPRLTGATRLVSTACARLCGAVSVCAPNDSGDVYRKTLPAHIMVQDITGDKPEIYFEDPRIKCVIAGPGGGYNEDFYRTLIHRAWDQKHLNGIILDAEGFKAWHGDFIDEFAAGIDLPTIVTPHEGEFEHVFDCEKHKDVLCGDKVEKAQKAADLLGAVVVLKGAQTVIAARGREAAINDNASPYLATAGAGDVLAGIIGGLVAQGMPAFEAACAGVWMHGRASARLGAGLVASDIVEIIPQTLKEMLGI